LVVVAAEVDVAKLAASVKAVPVVVVAVAPDAKTADAWEKAVREAGVYGQVTTQVWDAGQGLNIAEQSIATLIVDPAFLGGNIDKNAMLPAIVPGGSLQCKSQGKWSKTLKPRPDAMDSWPMYNHDSANSLHSTDTLVGPARGLQWVAGPTNDKLPYLFIEGNVALAEFHNLEADRKTIKLIARDAFTGLPLWDELLDEPANRYALVMHEGKVYIHQHHNQGEHGGKTIAIEARTGKLLKVYNQGIDLSLTPEQIKADRKVFRENIKIADDLQLRLDDGVLVQSTKYEVVALDAATGKRLWDAKPEGEATYAYPTIGDGMLFIHEGPYLVKNSSYTHWPTVIPEHLRAMDLKTGKPLWTWTWDNQKHGQRGSVWNMQYEQGRIASAMTVRKVVNKKGHEKTIAHGLLLDAKTGEELYFGNEPKAWPGGTGGGHSHVHMLLRGDTVFTTDGGAVFGMWNVNKPQDFTVVQDEFKDYGMRPIACSMFRSTPAWWVIGPNVYPMDLTGKPHNNRSGRSGCDIGAFPANGMIYLPPNACACQPYLAATKVYHSRAVGTPVPDSERLTKGNSSPAKAVESDGAQWPQFFQGPARRQWVNRNTPTRLKQVWQVKVDPPKVNGNVRAQWEVDAVIRGPITALSAAEGVLVYAASHSQQVVARDPGTGQELWSTTVEGRVDMPPTIAQGVVYCGTRDGYVYAFNRDTGELIWRFLAAPTRERIVVNAQLESAWPVFGAVPVVDEGVYVVAGRHTGSDGGLWWYLLDSKTGQIKSKGQWNELATQSLASIKGNNLPLDQQPIQNAMPVVSDKWFMLPGQSFTRHGTQLEPNTDWAMTGLDLKSLYTPIPGQREEKVVRFGTNTFIGEPPQTVGGYRKPRYAGTLARQYAVDPTSDQFISLGGGPKTAIGRGGGGGSEVQFMRFLDNPMKDGRYEFWTEVLWEHAEPMFQDRTPRPSISAMAVSDNAVYLAATIRNYDRKYEEQRKAMPHRLRILDLKTGEMKQDLLLPETAVFGGIALAGDRVFAVTEDGSITAFSGP